MRHNLGIFLCLFVASGLSGKLGPIILTPFAGDELRLAAEDLAEVIEVATGTRPAVLESRMRSPKNGIFLDGSRKIKSALHLPTDLEPGASVWRSDREGRVILRGTSEAALVDGVYTFAREQYGARWFVPGMPVKLVEPSKAAAQTTRVQRMVPAFSARQVVGLERTGDPAYARRCRYNTSYRFNHALASIFTPELFDLRPELFSTRNGRQKRPSGSVQTDIQPHLALPATAAFAAERVLKYFEENPEAVSFSLGINDNILYDETALTRELVEPIEWFRGFPNYSDLVFTFMNRVAFKVFNEAGLWETPSGEPRYLTALAYYWAEEVPFFELHPRILPVLTADRAQWHDPIFREEDKALIERWANTGVEKLGTWDYYMGPPLPYPRQYTESIAESIRHLSENQADLFFTALPFVLAFHGAQGYLLSELLWEPDQEVEQLLHQFYEGVFGPAASQMSQFYSAFAMERAAREGSAKWIKFFRDEASVGMFSGKFLDDMAGLLEMAEQAASDAPRALALIKEVQRDFQLTLDYHTYQQARRKLMLLSVSETPDTEVLIEALIEWNQQKESLENRLQLLFEVPGYRRYFAWLLPDGGAQSQPLAAAMGRLTLSDLNSKDLERLKRAFPEWDRWFFALEADGAFWNRATVVSGNSSLMHNDLRNDGRYLYPQPIPQITGWWISARPAQTLRVGALPNRLFRGLRLTGADVVSVFAGLPVEANQWYAIRATLRVQASPDNRTGLNAQWFDHSGRMIRSDEIFQAPVTWAEEDVFQLPNPMYLQIPLRPPEHAQSLRIRFAASRQYEGDYLEIEKVEVLRLNLNTSSR